MSWRVEVTDSIWPSSGVGELGLVDGAVITVIGELGREEGVFVREAEFVELLWFEIETRLVVVMVVG